MTGERGDVMSGAKYDRVKAELTELRSFAEDALELAAKRELERDEAREMQVAHEEARSLAAKKLDVSRGNNNRLRARIVELTRQLDEALGTPCEEIRERDRVTVLETALTDLRERGALDCITVPACGSCFRCDARALLPDTPDPRKLLAVVCGGCLRQFWQRLDGTPTRCEQCSPTEPEPVLGTNPGGYNPR